jgi:hypothetical protein
VFFEHILLTASKKRATDQRQVAHAQILLGKVQDKTKEKSNDIRRDVETARWFSDMSFTTSVEESMVPVPPIPGIGAEDTSDLEMLSGPHSGVQSTSAVSLTADVSASKLTSTTPRKTQSLSSLPSTTGLRQRRPTGPSASTPQPAAASATLSEETEDENQKPTASAQETETGLQMVQSAIVDFWRWFAF